MARPTGVRNQDFEAKRQALIEKLTKYALEDNNESLSFRRLAISAGTSEPTLRHYFTDRSGVITAILEHLYEISDEMREATRQPGDNISDALDSYHELLIKVRKKTAFIRAHAFGIRESMSDPNVRQAYLENLVEPGIESVAERLVKTPGGPRNFQTAKAAAFMLSASFMMLTLHQELLDGKESAPIDEDWYLELVTNWMKGGLETNVDGSDQA